MIKRRYFFSFKWNHNDGTSGYKHQSGIVSHKAIFRDSEHVYDKLKDSFVSDCKMQYPNGEFQAIAFNRV